MICRAPCAGSRTRHSGDTEVVLDFGPVCSLAKMDQVFI
ncbi:hypothetical protein Z948_16 [Sulfitobacter donghicola DSW-25 = KCTC 12864 = JCM 14565]|nr:hypothetical protein Z948_16 [Sulfitobacter donghicola DSW-25 = KCTC 12864 = JCM 14565]